MKTLFIAAGAALLIAAMPAPSRAADVFLAAAAKDGTPLYLRPGGRVWRASRFTHIYLRPGSRGRRASRFTHIYLRPGGRGRRASRFIRIYSPDEWARWTNTRQGLYDRRIAACGLAWYTTQRVIRLVQALRADEIDVYVVVRLPRSEFGFDPQPQGLARYRRLC